MSRLASDIDVNFLNEQVFDYIYAGYPLTESNTLAGYLEDSQLIDDLESYRTYLSRALMCFPKRKRKELTKTVQDVTAKKRLDQYATK